MSSDLASLVVKLEAQTAEYDKKLDQATRKLAGFKKANDSALRGVSNAFAALAGAITIDRFIEFGKAALDNADKLNKLAQSSGVGVEALSKLQFAASQSGVETEALGVGLKKLNESISEAAGNAKSDAAQAFAAMGVALKDANGQTKDAGTIIASVADRFAGYADGANKVALATKLFGKSGADLIPLLNQGSAGLKELGDQAQRAGLVISSSTAAAAEEFNDKVSLLKKTLIDGLGNRIEEKLLPTLDGLVTSFLDSADAGDRLDAVAEELATGFKLLVSGGLVVGEVFHEIGSAIGGAAAAVVAAAKGNFKEAAAILNEQGKDAEKSYGELGQRLAALWETGSVELLEAIKVTAKKIKPAAPNLADAIDTNKFLEKLANFRDALAEQLATLDQGTLAVTKYKLAHGELAEALAKTGAAGAKLNAQIIGDATKLEAAQVAKQVDELGASLKELQGDAAGAALDRFNASTEKLSNQLKSLNDTSGLKVVDDLRAATKAQADFNELQRQAEEIQSDLAIAEERINNSRKVGAISELESLQLLSDARATAAAQLDAIAEKERAIATESGNPALIQNFKRFESSIDSLKAQTDLFAQSVRTGLEDAFGNNFSDLITGAKSFKDALGGFLLDIEKQFADLVAKNFAQQLFGGGSGGSGGGFLGGAAGFLADLFGGAHANGGTIPPGKVGLVGEKGPELVYSGGAAMHVVPNAKMGGQTNVFNFTVQSPNGKIDRASQMQVAAAAARSLSQANRRNN